MNREFSSNHPLQYLIHFKTTYFGSFPVKTLFSKNYYVDTHKYLFKHVYIIYHVIRKKSESVSAT